jgi:hypothetical protein
MLVPRDFPRDSVIVDASLSPFDAIRHLDALTEIVYGKLSLRHASCLSIALDWVRRVRAVQKTIRVAGVDRGVYEGWVRLLKESHSRLDKELQRREKSDAMPRDRQMVKRAVRSAMNAVGWDDFGIDLDADAQKVYIFYPTGEKPLRESGLEGFRGRLAELLGESVAEGLEIRFRTVGR